MTEKYEPMGKPFFFQFFEKKKLRLVTINSCANYITCISVYSNKS